MRKINDYPLSEWSAARTVVVSPASRIDDHSIGVGLGIPGLVTTAETLDAAGIPILIQDLQARLACHEHASRPVPPELSGTDRATPAN
ncbi:hypothetical protein [Actinoplanes sp. NPDC026623]|uniref:hypothetical protein n=1 Tax=Actinoplanes sp. NPDC026623 TaxID=3155610 RepID=UPI0033FE47DE